MSLDRLTELGLDLPQVNLLVLSSCETALSNEDVEFYRQLKFTSSKSEALRKAQLNMLQQKVYVEGNQVRGLNIKVNLPLNPSTVKLQFDHPFYWAGFTIIGNPW